MVSSLELDIWSFLPSAVRAFIKEYIKEEFKVYLAGGTVRDIILKREVKDIDLAVRRDALRLARQFAQATGGTFILLDEAEKVARIVFDGYQVDFAGFRKGSRTIEADLQLRDLTINALAVCLAEDGLEGTLSLIDPAGGYKDIKDRLVRFIAEDNIVADPLRMLRAYRFAAILDFKIDRASREMVRRYATLLTNTAAERIACELDLMLGAKNSYPALRWMTEDGLFPLLCPEIEDMHGVMQYGHHHLDVYEHTFLTLYYMEKVQTDPAAYFPGGYEEEIKEYLKGGDRPVLLKWAALFHDLGKPKTAEANGEKCTFYQHDQVGAAIFTNLAKRFKWSHRNTRFVEKMIQLHMRPFHLVNVLRSGEVTPRALGRLIRQADGDLIGLFILAMADSLAGLGPDKPVDCEELLVKLFAAAMTFYEEKVRPLSLRPRLITGYDLIDIFGLKPGPIFKLLMEELEEARLEGRVSSREEALKWVAARLQELNCSPRSSQRPQR